MIEDFSLRDIIEGCLVSKDFASPECRLLNRISDGGDIPEYPEYDPERRYFFQMPKESDAHGPTGFYEYFTREQFLDDLVNRFGDYPMAIWEED